MLFLFFLAPLLLSHPVLSATYNLDASMTKDELHQKVWAAEAGDTFIFGPGTYNVDFVLSSNGLPSSYGSAPLKGTPGNPITFTSNWNGNPDNRPIISSDTTANGQSLGVFNIMDGAEFITIDGLRLTHSTSGTTANTNCGFYVWGGVFFEGGAKNVNIHNCEIDHITGTGIQMNYASDTSPTSFVSIVNNSIHDLGTATGCSSNGGYAIWGGRPRQGTTVIMSDITISNNLIYNTGGVDSYAISLDFGWIRSRISDNVIYNSPRGVGAGVRYTLLLQVDNNIVTSEADMVVVERNLIYASREAGKSTSQNVAVQVTPGVAFDNNLIIDAHTAIAIRKDTWTRYAFCRVTYNTIFEGYADASTGLFSLNGLSSSDESSFIVSNNVVFTNCGANCGDPWAAGNRVAYRWVGTQSANMIASSNYFQGADPGEASASVFKKLTTSTPTDYFNAPKTSFGNGDVDFLPRGLLVSAGSTLVKPGNDYDLNPRPSSAPSVGCFQDGGISHRAPTLAIKNPNLTGSSNPPSNNPPATTTSTNPSPPTTSSTSSSSGTTWQSVTVFSLKSVIFSFIFALFIGQIL